jgi:hypothetical protein
MSPPKSSFRIGGRGGGLVEDRNISRRCVTGDKETDTEGGNVEGSSGLGKARGTLLFLSELADDANEEFAAGEWAVPEGTKEELRWLGEGMKDFRFVCKEVGEGGNRSDIPSWCSDVSAGA